MKETKCGSNTPDTATESHGATIPNGSNNDGKMQDEVGGKENSAKSVEKTTNKKTTQRQIEVELTEFPDEVDEVDCGKEAEGDKGVKGSTRSERSEQKDAEQTMPEQGMDEQRDAGTTALEDAEIEYCALIPEITSESMDIDDAYEEHTPGNGLNLDAEIENLSVEQLATLLKSSIQTVCAGSESSPTKAKLHGQAKFWNTIGCLHPEGKVSSSSSISDDGENSDLEIGCKVKQARIEIEKKRKRGKATEEDEIDFLRLEEEESRGKKRARVQEEHRLHDIIDIEEGVSDNDDSDTRVSLHSHSQHESGIGQGGTASRKPIRKQKRVQKGPSQASKIQGVSGKKTELQKNLLTNLSSGGLHRSVFENIRANKGRDSQPTHNQKYRDKAFKAIIASIPGEDKPLAKIDMEGMKRHLKYFTPNGSCHADPISGFWKIKGMEASLDHHQMLGVAFMRRQESEYEDGRVPGGLICDAMGLGKTLLCLGNIMNGRPRRKKDLKTTLIILPGSLVTQWQGEIEKHCPQLSGSVGLQYSKSRVAVGPLATKTLSRFAVVLSTYSELSRSYPKYNPPVSAQTAEDKKRYWDEVCKEHLGPLHRMDFLRVILDEAQAIKNHQSQVSVAARALKSKFYWAVTATPAQNALSEFYPYFKFLRVPNTGSFKVFKKNFCGQDNHLGKDRLYNILRVFMLKRDHSDSLLGAKLLVLPEPQQSTMNLYFTRIEQAIYSIVYRRFAARINGFVNDGTLVKNYSHVLAMICRLRQLTGHPLLIQDTIRDLLEPEDFQQLAELAETPVGKHEEQESLLRHLRRMLSNPKALPIIEPDHISKQAMPKTTNHDTGGAFAKNDDTSLFLSDLLGQKPPPGPKKIRCGRCGDTPLQPESFPCSHVYCHGCILNLSFEDSNAVGGGSGVVKCLICGQNLLQPGRQKEDAAYMTAPQKDKIIAGGLDGVDGKKKQKKPSSKSLVDTWIDANGTMVPSTKTTAVKAILINYFEKDPTAKVIIYTQFLTMVRILDKMAHLEGWGSRQLHGSLSLASRDKNTREFCENPDINILISTLKTGGIGLNLTAASKVIIIDPWWNSSVEEQAFCRTYRRGQTKETSMHRLVVHDTIDAQVIALQERKDAQIMTVMTNSNRRKMSTADLLELFRTDEKSDNSFTLVEDRKNGRREFPHPVADDDISGDEA